jgi:zinc transporter 5/7
MLKYVQSLKIANLIYRYGRYEVLSGFINGVFLIFIAFLVLKESVERVLHPQEVNTDKLLIVSSLGLCVNLVGVFAFHDLHDHGGGGGGGGHSHSHGHSHGHGHGHGKGKEGEDHHDEDEKHDHKKKEHKKKEKKKKQSINVFGVYMHIIADTLGSIAVIISSILIEWKGWVIADPICSFCISIFILLGIYPLLKGSSDILLQCTPEDFEHNLEESIAKVS